MEIPLPCNLGDMSECDGRMLQLDGVSWFNWTAWGMEYIYFFKVPGNFWHDTKFYTTFKPKRDCGFIIPDSLIQDKLIKEHGYPLKGRGYASGILYENGKIFVDFIMTSNYFLHIKVQCNDKGIYVPGGEIIFPKSWDTEEKRQRAILKQRKTAEKEKTKGPDMVQLSIFDFIGGIEEYGI